MMLATTESLPQISRLPNTTIGLSSIGEWLHPDGPRLHQEIVWRDPVIAAPGKVQ